MSQDWVYLLYILRLSAAGLSAAACLIVLIAAVALGRWRQNMHVRLVGMCLLSVTLEAASELMGDLRYSYTWCTAQAVMSTFADWCCSMYVAFIATNIYMVIIRENYDSNTTKREWKYHIITFIIAAGFTTVPGVVTGNSYGPAGAWCWIVKGEVILRFVCWYFPLILIFLYVLVVYIIVLRKLRTTLNDLPSTVRPTQGDIQIKIARRMTAYPVIFLLVWAFPLASRVHDWITGDHQLPWLATTAATIHALQGLLYALAYGFDEEMVKRIRFASVYLTEVCKRGRGDGDGEDNDVAPFLHDPNPRPLNTT